MADQIYNLTQTGAEVQAIINDANNAKGAGATTSLSTDYIMLKDTSGQYHKIQKDSFTEAVRNTLASLLVNNDKGTTISQIAAIASGDFGSVTPANLASVLGGVKISIPSNTDLNTLQTVGVAYACISGSVTETLLHRPSDLIEAFTMYVLTGIKTQIIITTWGALKIYKRTYDPGHGDWYKWQKVTGTEVEYAT